MSRYVYICGPVSGMPDHNWPAFNAARSTVKQILGHVMVTIPHELVPSSVSEPLAMGLCLAALCAAVENGMDLTIVALPGWRDSLGSLVEVALARKLGVPVVELVGEELRPVLLSPDNTNEGPRCANSNEPSKHENLGKETRP